MVRVSTLCALLIPGLAADVQDDTGLVQSAVSGHQPWMMPVQQVPGQPGQWAMQPPPGWMPQQPQQGPWFAPPQPMAPPQYQPAPVMPAGPAASVPQAPSAPVPVAPSASQVPMNKYIFTLLPDNKMMCLQGPKSYLTAALERLRSSPLASHYAGSQVSLGMCNNLSYTNGPYPGTCFPRAALYTDNDPLHVMTMIDFDESEAQFYAGARNIPVESAMQELKTACDDGSMEEGLQLASEEFQAQVYVPPQASLIPDNGMACMQATMDYLNTALKLIKATKLFHVFANTDKPRPGMCSEHGYTVGAGAVVGAGHGRIKSKCFPKALMFWDRNATHLDQLMWAETRALKGPSHNFNFSKYEEHREEVQEMCGGRAETVYRPLPANLR